MVKLGQEVRDRITGYQGIVVSVTKFLNGCLRIGVQRKILSGDEGVPEPQVFDDPDLEVKGPGINKPPPGKKEEGGDRDFRPSRR